MPDINLDIGSSVNDFVREFLKQAKNGLRDEGFVPCSETEASVKIDLVATEVRSADGRISLRIFSGGKNSSDSTVQKMTIFGKELDEVEVAERQAKIAEANRRAEPPKRAFFGKLE